MDCAKKSSRIVCIRPDMLCLLAFLISSSIILSSVIQPVQGACSVGGCGGEDNSWLASAQSFIGSDVPLVGVRAGATANSDAAYSRSFKAGIEVGSPTNNTTKSAIPALAGVYVTPGSRDELFESPQMLRSLDALSGDEVVLDVSSNRSVGQPRIRGAVNIPAGRFFHENGTLRNLSELASLLGQAGISRSDSVVVYSETFRSGEATAVLWALRCLGHEEAAALDGGLDNWLGVSLPLESRENIRPQTRYIPGPALEVPADYDLVRSGQVQIVDARSFQDYGSSKIGNATWIGPENLLEEGRLKAGLNATFARLNVNQMVVVCSDDIFMSSLVWFALELMGYDTRIYTWQEHRNPETCEELQ